MEDNILKCGQIYDTTNCNHD